MIFELPDTKLSNPSANWSVRNVPDTVQQLTRYDIDVRHRQNAIVRRVGSEMMKRLTQHRMEAVAFSADRALANAKAQRLMSSLSSKFSLISKIQQNMG